jgi:simple sugar transport system substrate-binding protein
MSRRTLARLGAIVAAVTAAALLAGCSSSDESGESTGTADPSLEGMNISVVIPADAGDPFFTPMENAAKQAAADLGIEVDYQSTQKFDVTEEQRLLEAAIATKPDGIVVFVPDPDALGPTVKSATEHGIPVVFITSGQEAVQDLGALFYLGEDAIIMGRKAGELLKAEGVTNAICVNHSQGTVTLDQRCQGFAEGLAPGKSKVVVVDGPDPTQVKSRVAATLQADPSIEGIFTLGPPGAEPSVEAIAEVGKEGKVKLVTTDLSTGILDGVKSGAILAAFDQQQFMQVYMGIVALTLWNRYGVRPITDIVTAPNPITSENVDEVIDLVDQGIR